MVVGRSKSSWVCQSQGQVVENPLANVIECEEDGAWRLVRQQVMERQQDIPAGLAALIKDARQ